MKKRLVWFLIIVLAAFASFEVVKMTVFNHGPSLHMTKIAPSTHQQFGFSGMQRGGEFGHFSNGPHHMLGGKHLMKVDRGPVGHNSFMPLLFQLGLIGLGLTLWKLSAKNKMGKWTGAALLFIGLWALLPNWLVILAVLAVSYYLYKTRKNEGYSSEITGNFLTVPTQKLDFLDEWERSIMREEK